jgi:cytochrome P450
METDKAYFEGTLRRTVSQRIQEVKMESPEDQEQRGDILSLLCRANLREDQKNRLSDDELCKFFAPF